MSNHGFRSTIVNATMFVVCCCFILFVIVATISFLQSNSTKIYDSKLGEKNIIVDTIERVDTIIIHDTIVISREYVDSDKVEPEIDEDVIKITEE